MKRKIMKAAAVSAVLSSVISMTAFAGIIYAPGINGKTDDGQAVIVTETKEQQADNGGYVTIGGGQPSNTGSQNVIMPSGNNGAKPQAPISGNTTANTDLNTCASMVTVDPIMQSAPFLHVQLLKPSGTLTDGFTSNMGAFNSPEEGISGLKMRLENSIGDVYYRVYTDAHGWSKWAMNEMITPYAGDGAKVTAFQIRGNGHTRNLYDIYYRAVLNDGSVLDWAHDGQSAGTIGTGKYVQQVQVALWPKGQPLNQSTAKPFAAQNDDGVYAGSDGAYHYSTWNGQPYTGWGYDTANNKYYFKDSNAVTGWQYIDGYKYYFDGHGRVVTDLEPIIGLQKNYIIKVNKAMKTMTVYAKDGNNGYIMPVKVILNTIGPATPVGTFKTYEKYRWKFMHDDIYCQFLLRFKNGFILHSIIYQPQPTSHNLVAATYNYLGKNQSDGCVRMTSGDAAWVYTNCGVGTEITIYNDEWSTGPFDRPAIQQGIPFNQNYDPTDPVIVAKQQDDAAAAAQAQAEASTGVEAPPTDVAQ